MRLKYVVCICAWLLAVPGLAQRSVLPPLPPRAADARLSEALTVSVARYEFEGNTVFGDDQLRRVVEPFRGRSISSEELDAARRAVTLHYVNHGFITSGAVLEDQDVANGVVVFKIVEGQISALAIEGNRRLRSSFIQRSLQQHARGPININRLQEGLVTLKDNPNVKSVNAELKPDAVRGQSILNVKVGEAFPWRLSVEARNDRPPTVGAEVLELSVGHMNVTGNSDDLTLRYGLLHRLNDEVDVTTFDDWGVSYGLPLGRWGTSVGAYYDRNDFSVIEAPFSELDITSESELFGLSVRHPLYKTSRREIAMGVVAERRESRSYLFGEPFSFSGPGSANGTKAMVLRLFQEWVERNQAQVMALRSTFSFGLDVFDATTSGQEPDAVFMSWLGQFQYVRRLGKTQNQVVFNGLAQWASEPLLSLESFSIGGANTVRGYRENQLVRDMGLVSSIELRLPLVTSSAGAPRLQLAPFVDYGIGWDSRGNTPEPADIASAGLGLLWNPHRKVDARIYWGYAFRDFDTAGEDLQDHGVHFRVNVSAF